MEFTFWYKFFRYPTDGARVFAAFMGIAMLLVIFAGSVVADLLATETNSTTLRSQRTICFHLRSASR